MALRWWKWRSKRALKPWIVCVTAEAEGMDTAQVERLLASGDLGGVVKGCGHGPVSVNVDVVVMAPTEGAARRLVEKKAGAVLGSDWLVWTSPEAPED